MDYNKEKINNIVKTIIDGGHVGEYLTGEFGNYADMIDFANLGFPVELDKFEFAERLAEVNDIRLEFSSDVVKRHVAYGFFDAFHSLDKDIIAFFGFEYFINSTGYPNYYLGAVDVKYLFNHKEYMNIHHKCFDLLNNGATAEDVANIL